jgi:hypothetical protein
MLNSVLDLVKKNKLYMYSVHLLSIPKIEIKHNITVDKYNILHFQCIECTSFKTKFSYLYG